MKILVTGSSGRIGSVIVTQLLARGYTVRGFDMTPSNCDTQGYDEVVGTLGDERATKQAIHGVDAVLHLAAFMSWLPSDWAAMFSANVDGTRVLLDAAVDATVKRFVFASSGEVYPENVPLTLPITEEHPLRANSRYGLTKLLGEELVLFHQRNRAIDTVILRFSHAQNAEELLDESSFFSGPRFFLQPRIRQQIKFGNQPVADILQAADPGYPSHVLVRNERGRPWQMHITDTRDIAQGLILALESEHAIAGVFNLGATAPVDFTSLLSAMSGITGYPIVTVDLPGEGVFYHTANDKIRAELGYKPEWTIDRMLDEAAVAYNHRRGT